MIEDSVVREVRAARDAYAQSLGYDVESMVEDLRARDDVGDWPVVRLAPRHPTGSGAPRSGPDLAMQPARPVTVPTIESEPSLGGRVR